MEANQEDCGTVYTAHYASVPQDLMVRQVSADGMRTA